jgi:hypothetical protein
VPQRRTIVVISTADSGPGTLRQALQNAKPYDVITFDLSVFPPDAPATIFVASGLPQITQGNLMIDASNAGVILDGSGISPPEGATGISITSDYNTVRGLQIVGFFDAGIGLGESAQYNIIGGDRSVGNGPLGQGNLISGNGQFGIGLWGEDTSHNTIQGNYIGVNIDGTATQGHLARDGIHSNGATQNLITDNVIGGSELAGVYLCCVLDGRNVITKNLIGVGPSGIPLGNQLAGILIDRSRYNVVGPGNVIAHNLGDGISFWEDTPYNTVTQNIIHDNGGRGIVAITSMLQPPLIINFDIKAGALSGATCANCVVEIFSDSGDEGGIYEGRTQAGEDGAFTFAKGASFAGPILTATATDPSGNTSEFSSPTQGTSRNLSLQVGNALPMLRLQTKPSNELADNRTGASFNELGPQAWTEGIVASAVDLGLKRLDVQFGDVEAPIDWSLNEYELPQEFDGFVDSLAANGIALNYMLHFWDTAGHAAGEELGNPRFQNEEEVQEFLDYVRFFVRHFKGRILYYTIWSEQDACGPDSVKCIMPEDYVELVRQVIPVIREEDPEAKIVSGPNVLFFAREDLFTLLRSDVVKQFDVISWHGLYDVAPNIEFYGNYYYEYPSIVQEIKQTASAHGFQGEYWGTEMTWCSEEFPSCHPADQPWGQQKTDLLAAKYYARGIVMELGLDVGVGLGGFQTNALWSYPMIRNLNTVMAGNKPLEIAVEIESDAAPIASYGFSLPNGERLFAVWSDGVAADYDPGVPATLTFPGASTQKVIGIDVLHGFEQELISEMENGNLVIRDLLVKDYPIILRFTKPQIVEPTATLPEAVTIKLRKNAQERVLAGTPIQPTTNWLTDSQEHVADFLAAASLNGTLDGQPLPNLNSSWGSIVPYQGRGHIAQWLYQLGVLSPGTHNLEIWCTLSQPVTDGYDSNKDGQLDMYFGEVWRFSIHIEVY